MIKDKLLQWQFKYSLLRSKGKFYVYQIVLTIDGTKIHMKGQVNAGAKGGLAPLRRRNILVNVEFVLPLVWQGAHCRMVAVVHDDIILFSKLGKETLR